MTEVLDNADARDRALAIRMAAVEVSPPRRRRGSVRQQANGRWWARVRAGGHLQSATFDHRAVAEHFVRLAESHLPEPLPEVSMLYLRGLDSGGGIYRRRKPVGLELRKRVIDRYGATCMLCGMASDELVIDHIVAVAQGGSDDELNLWPAHHGCNLSRRDKPVMLWVHEHEAGHALRSGCCVWDATFCLGAEFEPATPAVARMRADGLIVAEALWRLTSTSIVG